MSVHEMTKLQFSCQNSLSSVLSAPSTAEYPLINEWSFSKDYDKNIIQVESYVDAQNSYGAVLRNDFIFQFKVYGEIENGEYILIYAKLDDTVLVDTRE